MAEVTPIISSQLNQLTGVSHGFFTREGGVSKGIYAGLNAGLGSGDERSDVIENRTRIARYLGVDLDHLVSPYQIHSPDVVTVTQNWGDDRPKADGVVTDVSGLALGIVTADCGPVLFADHKAGVIGACHAGWKGALGGVLENTVHAMEDLGANVKNITAVLGPTISQINYEVGPNFPNPFLSLAMENQDYFTASKTAGHFMFDLVGYIVDRLAQTGVKATATLDCTYEDESRFFSYRRTTHRTEPDYGRQLSAIVLQK